MTIEELANKYNLLSNDQKEEIINGLINSCLETCRKPENQKLLSTYEKVNILAIFFPIILFLGFAIFIFIIVNL